MTTHSVVLKETPVAYPEGFPQMLKMSDMEFVAEIRVLAAAKPYEMSRLTAGKAAQPAPKNRAMYDLPAT
ncbi:MAG: UPF0175 family protein [Caldilineaceae bacterium]|nr:UPF0175 family protein [Caldilineaceae bacterium]